LKLIAGIPLVSRARTAAISLFRLSREHRMTEHTMNPDADGASADWRRRLISDRDGIRRLLERTRRVAVLGIKIEDSGQPAYYVAEYAQQSGYDIVPVPVYYPDVTEILGQRVYRRIADVPGPVDLVNVFRRPKDIPPHLDDIIAKRPSAVWFQLGIRHDAAAERLAREGIDVVQDRCLLVELQRIGR
jgi:predicted CoA-binding protein